MTTATFIISKVLDVQNNIGNGQVLCTTTKIGNFGGMAADFQEITLNGCASEKKFNSYERILLSLGFTKKEVIFFDVLNYENVKPVNFRIVYAKA